MSFEDRVARDDLWIKTLSRLAPIYSLALKFDQRRQVRGSRYLDRPTISVGNLTVGGTGKTPVVAAIAQALMESGQLPVVLSRGYRPIDGRDNDESLWLRRKVPGLYHFTGRERYESGCEALGENPDLSSVLLDDGFQHRRLGRDVDVVVIDATRPFGFGKLLPAGLLRETIPALARAHFALITRASLVSGHKLRILRTYLSEFHRLSVQVVRERYGDLRRVKDQQSIPLDGSRPVGLFAGIGNPQAFFSAVRNLGLDVYGVRSYPDHYDYGERDLQTLNRWAQEIGVNRLICTEKDGVKLQSLRRELPNVELLELGQDYEFDTQAVILEANRRFALRSHTTC